MIGRWFNFSPITKKRFQRFKTIKRGYYSFVLLASLIVLSLGAELLMNKRAIVVHYQGAFYFPLLKFYPGTTFGEANESEAEYRKLKKKWAQSGEGTIIMPLIQFDPYEYDFSEGEPPTAPSTRHLLGTDDRGRDILARLFYGFRIAIVFSIILTLVGYTIGIIIGSIMGYFGGWVDLIIQRGIEVWQSVPFLYFCIIIASVFTPTFSVLLLILVVFNWIGMSYFVRTEVYREKSKDYYLAAKSMGSSHHRIMFKHLLPNSLVPVISYFPFNVVAGINSLTALDFLGYGLPPPTPSWGELMAQGLEHLHHGWWIVTSAFVAIVITLLLVTFIGEAIREAFDPRQYSRYE